MRTRRQMQFKHVRRLTARMFMGISIAHVLHQQQQHELEKHSSSRKADPARIVVAVAGRSATDLIVSTKQTATTSNPYYNHASRRRS